jgi:predicted enzyme related to lactoylglutathione lyase
MGGTVVLTSRRRKEADMTRPVVAFQVRGKDPQRLAEFYRALFGWDIGAPNPMGIMSIPAGIGGPEEGVGGHIMGAEAPGVSIFVQVLDPVETLRLAEEMGGRGVMQPFDVPGGPTVAQVADPEGNLIGLVKQ